MLAKLLDLGVQLGQCSPSRINGTQQAVQGLLFIQGGLGQGNLLLVQLSRDLRRLRLAIGAGLGQLGESITLLCQVLGGFGTGGKRFLQRLHFVHQRNSGLLGPAAGLRHFVQARLSLDCIGRVDFDAELCNIHRLTLNKCPWLRAVFPFLRHDAQGFAFQHLKVREDFSEFLFLDAEEPGHVADAAVVEADRTAGACSPLGGHAVEKKERRPVAWPDLHFFNQVARGKAEHADNRVGHARRVHSAGGVSQFPRRAWLYAPS